MKRMRDQKRMRVAARPILLTLVALCCLAGISLAQALLLAVVSAGAQVVRASQGNPEAKALANGEMMFRGQCAACHTTDGYRSMKRLLQGRDRNSIMNMLKTLHENKEDSPYRAFMPPLVGTRREVDALADYLQASSPKKARQWRAKLL